ncbi:5370_t:CDS:2 [Racocetra fulgida]|uniref:5370_t:CDS:1 n=1 Tax=Racocetra fulgida TaxID=60492 RepID=A0A9N9ALN9_9GLOM|nr:5370_t:CDS:2 [Racocetra fulgida]
MKLISEKNKDVEKAVDDEIVNTSKKHCPEQLESLKLSLSFLMCADKENKSKNESASKDLEMLVWIMIKNLRKYFEDKIKDSVYEVYKDKIVYVYITLLLMIGSASKISNVAKIKKKLKDKNDLKYMRILVEIMDAYVNDFKEYYVNSANSVNSVVIPNIIEKINDIKHFLVGNSLENHSTNLKNYLIKLSQQNSSDSQSSTNNNKWAMLFKLIFEKSEDDIAMKMEDVLKNTENIKVTVDDIEMKIEMTMEDVLKNIEDALKTIMDMEKINQNAKEMNQNANDQTIFDCHIYHLNNEINGLRRDIMSLKDIIIKENWFKDKILLYEMFEKLKG